MLSAGVVASGTAGKLGMLFRGIDSSGRTWLEVAGTGALAKAAMGRPAACTGPIGGLSCGPRALGGVPCGPKALLGGLAWGPKALGTGPMGNVSCGPVALVGLPWGPVALVIEPCGPRVLGGLA